ncbi:hypothetical protein COU58_01030 [Candidatus Pacearchaeota archaeon CG10_big_fil_rev_8_21_14_0_10_32_42]|nr:MAG: hypothetical protein COU58_01030 [Candidatus Pacearchaeota archaeon CG10_big_fil_rev_8_21_14_0_10_32_42]
MITTPNRISKEILEFCGEMDPTTKPIFLKLFRIEGYVCEEGYGNVEKRIEKNGGSIQYGWIIWEDPKIFLEAEFHAVWINNEGEYIDITPKIDEEKRILFLPDSKKKFTGNLIDNLRKPLVDNKYTRNLVKGGKNKFEIKNRNYKESLKIKKRKIGRNEPCPCGSGKKYKRCCGTS